MKHCIHIIICRTSVALILFFYLNAFTEKPEIKDFNEKEFLSIIKLLKDGDLVMRLNNDPKSDLIRRFNRIDKSFSHAGMIVHENGIPFVFHMITGPENPGGKLKKEAVESFSNPENNSSVGFYRYEFNDAARMKARAKVYHLFNNKISFDTSLDLNSDDQMYCAEMVKKVVEEASGNTIRISTTQPDFLEARIISFHNNIPAEIIRKRSVVAPENLYLVKQCSLVKKFTWGK